MKTYLFTWNSKRWKWRKLAVCSEESLLGEVVYEPWSCYANAKRIKTGDRAFLVHLGEEPKGLMASGWVISEPRLGAHWNKQKAAQGETTPYVDCKWDRLINPQVDTPLLLSELRKGKLGSMHWTPQSSGVEIPENIARKLEKKWAAFFKMKLVEIIIPDVELAAVEGEQRMALVRHRRREQFLRDAKIQEAKRRGNGRLRCEVPGCGFDFEAVYGELGQGYAHVHHLKPIGDRAAPSRTKLSDLTVVCANCHAMIHRGGRCRALGNLIPLRLRASVVN